MKILDLVFGTGLRATMIIAVAVATFHVWAELRVSWGEPRMLHQRLELSALDVKLKRRAVRRPERRGVAIAAFDERAIATLGPPPWRRTIHADLVNELTKLGASAIAFDLTHERASPRDVRDAEEAIRRQAEALGLFSLPPSLERTEASLSRTAARLDGARRSAEAKDVRGAARALAEAKASVLEFQSVFESASSGRDPDQEFARAVAASGRVIFGIVALSEAEAGLLGLTEGDVTKAMRRVSTSTISDLVDVDPEGLEHVVSLGATIDQGLYRRFFGLVTPYPLLAAATPHFATLNNAPDEDGVNRRMPLVSTIKGQRVLLPTLGLKVAELALGERAELLGSPDAPQADALRLGDHEFPLEFQAATLLNWYGRFYDGTLPVFSVVDILEGKVPKSEIEGRAIIVAGTALGTYDQRVTPLEESVPGVYIHATLAQNLLDGRSLNRPFHAIAVELLVMLGVGLVAGLVMMRLNVLGLAFSAVALSGSWVLVDHFVFFERGVVVYTVLPVVQIFLTSLAVTLVRFFTEQRERRRTRQAFGQYLSPAVLEQVLSNPQEYLRLGGKRYDATVLFSDIRGFTTISEALTPEALGLLLNRYMTPMTNIVFAHQGTLDKYIGDAVMAFWGAPIPHPDHALLACRASLSMQATVGSLSAEFEREGLPSIAIGIGLSSGPMTIGNMGSDAHFAYTALGDRVNLGSRLESQTKFYGVQILVSEDTFSRVKEEMLCRELGMLRVKGKIEPVKIYELVGERSSSEARLPWVRSFEDGLALYRARAWDEAIETFRQAMALAGEHKDKASKLYISWCEEYKAAPPPADWVGVHVAATK